MRILGIDYGDVRVGLAISDPTEFLAGGIGSRFGADRPKQYCTVFGKEMIWYSIDAFRKAETIDDFIARVEGAIESFTETYDAGVAVGSNLTVTYIWEFDGNVDANDTYLGDEAAAGRAATIKLDVTCTVTQID